MSGKRIHLNPSFLVDSGELVPEVPEVMVSDSTLESLATALCKAGVQYSHDTLRQRVADLVSTWQHLVRERNTPNHPSVTDIRATFKAITAMPEQQRLDAFHKLDSGTQALIWSGLYELGVRRLAPERFPEAMDKASELYLDNRTGRSQKDWRQYHLAAILDLWITLGGDPTASLWKDSDTDQQSPLTSFVLTLCEAIEKTPVDFNSVRDALKLVRSKRNSKND